MLLLAIVSALEKYLAPVVLMPIDLVIIEYSKYIFKKCTRTYFDKNSHTFSAVNRSAKS